MDINHSNEYKSPSVKVINLDMSDTILIGSNDPNPGGNEGIGEEGM